MIREKQVRLVYSLLKPALRVAARFNVPIRTLSELVRLAYYEVLSREGLGSAEIAERFGQTSRHMRTLAQKLKGDFFAAEHEIGSVREAEDAIASGAGTLAELKRAMRGVPRQELESAVATLLEAGRVEIGDDGRWRTGARYAVLASEQFHHRIDTLNHYLDAGTRAVVQRLVHDDRKTAMIKTISFTADPDELRAFLDRLEGELRREIGVLEESASFRGIDQRFTFALTLARVEDRRE
jgi:DNA-binding transcriptional ArsR family regulator